MTRPDFSAAEFLAWCRTKPADERYNVDDTEYCALGQFGAATDRDFLDCYSPEKTLGIVGLDAALGFDSDAEKTFGALVKRLEAVVQETAVEPTPVAQSADLSGCGLRTGASMSAGFTPGPWEVQKPNSSDKRRVIAPMQSGFHVCGFVRSANDARLIAAAPCMAVYIQKRADAGDPEAIELWERINANS